ncbi:MAG: hypothetical protein GY867_09220 [bacterium]|nr:hypothetical protein [bacterium]
MGWRFACIIVNESGGTPLKGGSPYRDAKAQAVLGRLGLRRSAHVEDSNLLDAILPPEGHVAIGAYDSAVIWCDQLGFDRWVRIGTGLSWWRPHDHYLKHLCELSPTAEVLAVELLSYNDYAAYALYSEGRRIRRFMVDCDHQYLDEGEIQPEEQDILNRCERPQDAGEELAFAMMSRVLGTPFDRYPSENLAVSVYRKRNIWWKLFGREYLLK